MGNDVLKWPCNHWHWHWTATGCHSKTYDSSDLSGSALHTPKGLVCHNPVLTADKTALTQFPYILLCCCAREQFLNSYHCYTPDVLSNGVISIGALGSISTACTWNTTAKDSRSNAYVTAVTIYYMHKIAEAEPCTMKAVLHLHNLTPYL